MAVVDAGLAAPQCGHGLGRQVLVSSNPDPDEGTASTEFGGDAAAGIYCAANDAGDLPDRATTADQRDGNSRR
jgi:hypothetical protein